jgi:hypothetical protein
MEESLLLFIPLAALETIGARAPRSPYPDARH